MIDDFLAGASSMCDEVCSSAIRLAAEAGIEVEHVRRAKLCRKGGARHRDRRRALLRAGASTHVVFDGTVQFVSPVS